MTTATEALRLALDALTYKGDYRSKARHTKKQTAIEAVRAALAALTAGEPAATGGSPEHLLQDQHRGLSQWLAGKPDAKLHAREAAAAIVLAAPAVQAEPVVMRPMDFEDGRRGWYIDHPDFYCDLEPDANGTWSVFFRTKDGEEAFAERAAPTAQQAPQASAPSGEPVAWCSHTALEWLADRRRGKNPSIFTRLCRDKNADESVPLYAAPQAAPAPLPLTDDARDAARYRWLKETMGDHRHGLPSIEAAWDDDIDDYRRATFFSLRDGDDVDAAIDAELADSGTTATPAKE